MNFKSWQKCPIPIQDFLKKVAFYTEILLFFGKRVFFFFERVYNRRDKKMSVFAKIWCFEKKFVKTRIF